jgi:hypothetical protein
VEELKKIKRTQLQAKIQAQLFTERQGQLSAMIIDGKFPSNGEPPQEIPWKNSKHQVDSGNPKGRCHKCGKPG